MDQAISFVDYINNNNLNLKFTFEYNCTTITFLDVLLTGNIDTGVIISPYRKSTAANSVLLATSCHPEHVTKNLPIGELVRMKCNSTTASIIRLKRMSAVD